MRFLRLTIRQRLPLFISISALLILLLQGYLIFKYSVRFYEQEFQDRIKERLLEADSLIAQDRLHPTDKINQLPPSGLYGELIYYATDPGQIKLPQWVDTSVFHRNMYNFAHMDQRDYGIRHDTATHHTLVISAIDPFRESKIRHLLIVIVGSISLAVFLLTLSSWFWVKRMLQPVANKISKARAIGAKSLNLRLDVKNNYDELGELALTFNEMLDRIEQGFRTQQQFIRSASHEMRTPLTAITAEADLALQQQRSPEHYQRALEQIRASAESLNELVAQLLLLAKVETKGGYTDQLCPADEVLLLALRALQIKYPQASQRVQIELDAPDAAQFLLPCDPVLLQTAFFNLLDNAVKYGNDKAILARLFLQDQSVHFEVVDQGIGIDPDEVGHLFDPFYRGKNNNNQPGSGIGLSLVKNIAEKFGGSIQLKSELGKGTHATLSLPGKMPEKNKF